MSILYKTYFSQNITVPKHKRHIMSNVTKRSPSQNVNITFRKMYKTKNSQNVKHKKKQSCQYHEQRRNGQ